jgi:LiaI-LiaF-like transmembrane region
MDTTERSEETTNMGYTQTPPTTRRVSLMGPVVLITLGLMFLLAQFMPGWGIGRTWPALLIVIGVIKLLDAGRPPRPPEGPRV